MNATATANHAARGPRGRFAPGNRGGPGNPQAARVGKLRQALLDAIDGETLADVLRSVAALALDRAEDSRVRLQAAELVMERMIGLPVAADIIERLAALEAALADDGDDNATEPAP